MKTKRAPRSKRGACRVLLVILLSAGALFTLFSVLFVALYTRFVSPEMDDALFRAAGADTVTRFYYEDEDGVARTGEPYLAVEWESERLFAGEKCFRTDFSDMPTHLRHAFIAIEDHRFYSHDGVDVLRTGRAVLNRIFGSKSFGGSTITQQLIKNIGGEREKTVKRKIKEIMRALALERRHSKDEILEAYLNIVPLSRGCIGVGAGSRIYFDKQPSELTLAEAASLAAITRAPARYDPISHPEAHLERRNLVLRRMWECKYIDEESYLEAVSAPLGVLTDVKTESTVHSWYTERVMWEIERDLMEKGYTQSAARALLYGGGLHIFTALDMDAQRALEAAFSDPERFASYGEGFSASAVIFSPVSGRLVATVGGIGSKTGNRLQSHATDILRAPGSVLKIPALFAPALEEGRITEATVFDDVPKSFSGDTAWPRNSPARYEGLISTRRAVAMSKNTVSVDLYRMLGAEHIYHVLSEDLGISSLCRRERGADGRILTDLAEAPLALGQLTRGVTLYEMSRAYLPFAANGEMRSGGTYLLVTDSEGRELLRAEDTKTQPFSERTASVVTHLLSGVVEEGSASALSLPGIVDTAGKTGSSGGNRDRWFIGYTPYYLCGVWCGYEKGGLAVSGTPHLSLFDAVMMPLHDSLPEGEREGFSMARGLVKRTVCADSGKIPCEHCGLDERGKRTETVWVPAESLPLGTCDVHVLVFYDDAGDGVAVPPRRGDEAALRPVALLRLPERAFPFEVTVEDAEYGYRELGDVPPAEGDVPFYQSVIPEGVYVGRSHPTDRPFNATAASPPIPPYSAPSENEEGTQKKTVLPPWPRRARGRLSHSLLPFFGL